MKKVLFFFCCLPFWVFSQDFTQHIFAVQGGFDQTDNMSVSWTIGENFTETIYAPKQIITQGFQQSFLKIKPVFTAQGESLNVNIFPNPTSGVLQIDTHDEENLLQVEIFDANGKILYRHDDFRDKSELDFSDYASGLYLLRISDLSNSRFSLFNIIKH